MSNFSRVLIGLMALTVTGVLQAATINSIEIQANLNPKGTFDISCGEGAGCQGFLRRSSLTLSPEFATAWGDVKPGRRGGFQAAFLDGRLGQLDLDPLGRNYTKFDKATSSFETDREYFWIKKGQWTTFFRNTSGGAVTVRRDMRVSHSGAAGALVPVAETPIPPAFLLFASALVGMGWLARRQRDHRAREAVAV